jgi:multidrug efflux pump subunit AcrA (membrane-fusion protein)
MILAVTMGLVLSGCKKETIRPPGPRPVTVVELKQFDPSEALRLTGVVEAWAEQDIGFEVAGRVTYVAEEGTFLRGHWEEGGHVIEQGDMLGTLDPSIYEASLTTAQAELAWARVNLENIYPAELDVAEAQRALQEATFARMQEAYDRDVATITELDEARARRDVSRAQVERAEAKIDSGHASVAKAQAELIQAQLDLGYATLVAPFTSEVAELFVRVGGFVQPGNAVAHLVVMDPVKVKVTVSAETSQMISLDDDADVYLPGRGETFDAQVYQKSTVADAATRTFTVTLLMRNRRVPVNPPADAAVYDLPRGERVLPVMAPYLDEPDRAFVDETRCLRQDDDGHFLWAIEDLDMEEGINWSNPVYTVRKVRVVLGEERFNLQGIYLLRELTDIGGLAMRHPLVVNPPEDMTDGSQIALIPMDWAIRPGGLVQAQFRRDQTPEGFYVPLSAILPTGANTGVVFAIDEATATATKLTVRLGRTVGDLQQIEGDGLADGMNIAVEGVNYLQEGESVSIIVPATD